MLTLRPYQEKLVASVLEARKRGRQRVMAASPTGTGKTVSFVALHNRWPEPGRTLVLAHREELLAQAAASFIRADPGCWVEAEQADRRAGSMAHVIVASVQTLGRPNSRRLEGLKPRLVICDESHHAVASSYLNVFRRFGCFDAGGPFLVGVTATPKRLDRLNLHSVFEEQVFSYSIREAIADGWLCDIVGYRVRTRTNLRGVKTTAGDYNRGELERAVDNEERTALAIRHWQEVASDRPTIVFCAGVAHAAHTAAAFRVEGIRAAHVHGGMGGDERRELIARFKAGRLQVLCNVDILTEGFDYPGVSCIVMLRPTQSWGLYVQAVGRGTRLCPETGKENLTVIDVVDNCDRHSLATVPAILDLPASLDLQGNSLAAAARKLDELGARAAMLSRYEPEKFADIETMLQQVDLLAQVETPREVRDAGCRLAWLAMPDGSYRVSCGLDRATGARREVSLTRDLLGAWTLSMTLGGETALRGILPPETEPGSALQRSDRAVLRHWPEVVHVAAQDARWRAAPPTENQLRALRKFRVPPELLSELDRGTASALLDQCIARRRGERPQRAA